MTPQEHPQPVDLRAVRTVPLVDRANKVSQARLAQPARPGRSLAEVLRAWPRLLAAESFHAVVQSIVEAVRHQRTVIAGIGGHVIKCGLGPLLIDLIDRGVVTAVAMNGAAAIHDCEMALIGGTSEDVAAGLGDGSFGMARETGEFMNAAVRPTANQAERGMGRLLGERLRALDGARLDLSVLGSAAARDVPVTVHVALGADIVHMHPSADGAAIGRATLYDFRLLAGIVSGLSGGVYLNLGSAVLLPEVFLKAFNIAQNLGAGLHDFVTVNMDMQAHYRPAKNVLERPAGVGGRAYHLIGHHEIMIPLLAHAVVDALESSHDAEDR